jgi:hypothetical protein
MVEWETEDLVKKKMIYCLVLFRMSLEPATPFFSAIRLNFFEQGATRHLQQDLELDGELGVTLQLILS